MKFLKNHPFAVEAFFDSSLVLTFAVPKEQLQNFIFSKIQIGKTPTANIGYAPGGIPIAIGASSVDPDLWLGRIREIFVFIITICSYPRGA